MEEIKLALTTLLVCIGMVFVIMFTFNSCTSPVWNDGICIKCNVDYELKGVSNYLKYYECPSCKHEVNRY
jgi:hypothetical protein